MRTPSESATGKSAARGAGVKRRCAAAVGLLVLAGQSAANAQTLEAVVQDLQLDPGWNAVYLRVDAPVEERIRLLERAGVSTGADAVCHRTFERGGHRRRACRRGLAGGGDVDRPGDRHWRRGGGARRG